MHNDESDASALAAILAAERRRKLLGRGARGVDLARLGRDATATTRRVAGATSGVSGRRAAGAPASSAADASTATEGTANGAEGGNDEKRLKLDFAGGRLAGTNDMGGDGDDPDGDGVLAKKHRAAMESYIASNLALSGAPAVPANKGDSNDDDRAGAGGGEGEAFDSADAERRMYAEILLDDANDAHPGAEQEGQATTAPPVATAGGGDAEKEGDVGAGGAMMGGTGIAEVALPVDERLRSLRETERAAAARYERSRGGRYRHRDDGDDDGGGVDGGGVGIEKTRADAPAMMAPVEFASGPGKKRGRPVDESARGRRQRQIASGGANQSTAKSASVSHRGGGIGGDVDAAPQPASSALPSYSASSAGPSVQRSDVSDLGSSYAHNFQLHTREWATKKRDEAEQVRRIEEGADGGGAASEECADGERVGFEMSRKVARGEVTVASASSATGGRNAGGGDGQNRHASDERVWRQFMSNQRNRR